MPLTITLIYFETNIPSLFLVSKFFEEQVGERIVFIESEKKGKYFAHFEVFPKDTLEFEILEEKVVIAGFAENAPVLRRTLLTCLEEFGGNVSSEFEPVEFPLTFHYLSKTNQRVKKHMDVNKLAIRENALIYMILTSLGFGVLFFSFINLVD